MGRNIHVVPYQNGWAVKAEGAQEPMITSPIQAPAIAVGRIFGQLYGSELFIHLENGQFGDRESYGNDPCPARDTR